MSNRRKRRARRQAMTPAERWAADRYRPHRNMSAAEVRQVIVDDGIVMRATPLTWMVRGIEYIAVKSGASVEQVTTDIDAEVRAANGVGLSPYVVGTL